MLIKQLIIFIKKITLRFAFHLFVYVNIRKCLSKIKIKM